jgi:DNA helicase HerA-like ATPase
MRKEQRELIESLVNNMQSLTGTINRATLQPIEVRHTVTQERVPHPNYIAVILRTADGSEWRYGFPVTRNSISPIIQIPSWVFENASSSNPPVDLRLEYS